MVEITYQMVLSTLQTLGLLVGICYYIMTLNFTRRTQQLTVDNRRAQLWMQIQDVVWSKESQDALDVIWPLKHLSDKEFLEKHREDWKFRRSFTHWAYVMERMGVLFKEGLIDIELVAASASSARTLITDWEYYRNVIYKLRQIGAIGKHSYNMWEHVYDVLMKYYEEHPELAP
jgi:hypothetical protein